MPVLPAFSTPARVPDRKPAEWSERVSELFQPYVDLLQFYDPTVKATPARAPEQLVSWVAFPARQLGAGRLKAVDEDRALQDEYCEWTVVRKGGKIQRITFTTEVPEYYEHLLATQPDRLVKLFRKFVDPRVKLEDLRDGKGRYRRSNRWNASKAGRLAHLSQENNTLAAAIDLVARATVPRVGAGGKPVVNQQELVECAGLGNPLRHSDPQIAGIVNGAARGGAEITFADPPGLYLGAPLTAGMVTPDGADAAKFWKIERGTPQHTLRARFEVPADKKYTVGDIRIGNQPIEFGGQVAKRVQVRVSAIVKPGNHKPKARRCGEP